MKDFCARLSLLDKLQGDSDDLELIKVAGEVMESEEANGILQKLNGTTRSFVLMAYLGYDEAKVLDSAVQMIKKLKIS